MRIKRQRLASGALEGARAARAGIQHLGPVEPVDDARLIPVHECVRPIALGQHRYKWLHVTVFVPPSSGEAVWSLSNGLSKPLFEGLLASFAQQTGAGRDRRIVLVLDNLGVSAQRNSPGLARPREAGHP